MRLFVAIELSEEVRNELARIQSHLKYAGSDVKWVAKENVHLTLKFLDEILEENVEKIGSALDAACQNTKPFELSLKGVGAFPNIDFPRVVWAGLDKGAVESKALAAHIDEALSGLGLAKESREFAAHLTIGRVRSSKNRETLREKVKSVQGQGARGKGQVVASIILFQSTLTRSGPIYKKIHESKFQGQG